MRDSHIYFVGETIKCMYDYVCIFMSNNESHFYLGTEIFQDCIICMGREHTFTGTY